MPEAAPFPPSAGVPAFAYMLGGYEHAAFAQYIYETTMSPRGVFYAGEKWVGLAKQEMAYDLWLTDGAIDRIIGRLSDLTILIRVARSGQPWLSRIDTEMAEALTNVTVVEGGDSPRIVQGSGAAVPYTGVSNRKHQLQLISTPSNAGGSGTRGSRDLTHRQVADQIQKGYWSWVKERSGHHPYGIGVLPFKSLITPLLEAGVDPGALKKALATMYERGDPLTRQGIERTLDGRSGRRGPKPATQQLREMEFDADGNIVL